MIISMRLVWIFYVIPKIDKYQKSMNEQELGSVFESLQTFMELKIQNFLIVAWIQLKKRLKAQPQSSNRSHLQNRQQMNYNQVQQNGVGYHQNRSKAASHQQSISSASPRSIHHQQRLVTEYHNGQINPAMFETFNQNGTTKWQSLHQDQHSRLKTTIQPDLVNQENVELQDSGEFQDIVIDRLSKLEQSVNDMMRQKKIKEELRGYVGAPIQHQKRMQDFLENCHQNHYVEPPSDRTEEHDESFNKRGYEKEYQSWETSPVGKKKKQHHTGYNMKYIPIQQGHSTVNINKIRQMLIDKGQKAESVASSSRIKEDQHFIDNVGFFNNHKIRERQKQKKSSYNSSFEQYRAKKGHHDLGQETKPKPSAQQYFHKYGYSNTTKNKVAPLQFIPHHIEMQSVIEPGTKFVRSPRSIRNTANFQKTQPKNPQLKQFFQTRKSGESSISNHSQYSTPLWRPNISTLY